MDRMGKLSGHLHKKSGENWFLKENLLSVRSFFMEALFFFCGLEEKNGCLVFPGEMV